MANIIYVKKKRPRLGCLNKKIEKQKIRVVLSVNSRLYFFHVRGKKIQENNKISSLLHD